MKISYNWLKEFADVPVNARMLADEFTNAGLQLESREEIQGDTLLDFEVTVNRPDCLSVFGTAREAATLFGLNPPQIGNLHPVEVVHVTTNEGSYHADGRHVRIILEDTNLCPRYCGQLFTQVRVGPSPPWLSRRLEAMGVRSINNVVDITNYVMLEIGQPMHAFDYDRLADGTIRVRHGKNERLLMLDGRERIMDASILVIADAERAQAVGGVMGGSESEVSPATTTILLESAYFEPGNVRSVRRKLELSTEASYRFERGADPKMQAIACRRAASLLQELAGATVHPVLDVAPLDFLPKQVALRLSRVAQILGRRIDPQFVQNTLSSLGFKLVGENVWEVPSFRVDIEREIDLIEEVARTFGYNNFAATLPPAERKYQPDYATFELERAFGRFLRGAGVDEAYTLTFVGPETRYQSEEKRVTLLNPISETTNELRSSIIPNLIESVEYNLRHRNEDVRLFEIGRVFLTAGEKTALGIVMLSDVAELKGLIESGLPALGYSNVSFDGKRILVEGKHIGYVDQKVLETRPVWVAEIYLSDLIGLGKGSLRYEPIITYPAVERDATFLLDEGVQYGELEQVFRDLEIPELRSYKLLYRYKGPNIPSGKVTLTFRMTFQAPDRTLTSEEVDRHFRRVVNEITTRFNAELR
jgi:phenylalanyl-tRNA synthetase beta chain